jgi:hypothetical protein
MGHIFWASEVFNCSAPDTGNMEVLHRYGTREHKDDWLLPLMNGEIRSAFLMTEPEVASSDATNIQTSIIRDGDDYVINGRKWWSTGIGDPRCKIAIVMGKTDPEADRHRQQSMILVPMDTPGVQVKRMLSVYGYDHAPHGHGEVILKDVRVPLTNMLLGEGRGFGIVGDRLDLGALQFDPFEQGGPEFGGRHPVPGRDAFIGTGPDLQKFGAGRLGRQDRAGGGGIGGERVGRGSPAHRKAAGSAGRQGKHTAPGDKKLTSVHRETPSVTRFARTVGPSRPGCHMTGL